MKRRAYKAELEAKAERLTPHLMAYEAKAPKPKMGGWRWALTFWAPFAATLAAAVIAIAATAGGSPSYEPSFRLTHPELRKSQDPSATRSVSGRTRDLYLAYFSKAAPLALAGEGGASASFSLPDAFVSFCLNGYLSAGAAQEEFLAALGASSAEELSAAAREIIQALGTTYGTDEETFGGYLISSLWLDADYSLADDLSAIEETLENDFCCSLFHALPSAEDVKAFFASAAPAGFAAPPSIAIPDDPSLAAVAATSYACYDHYERETLASYRSQYLSGTHKMTYSLPDGTEKDVDYIGGTIAGPKYVGSSFIGSTLPIHHLEISYFLPEEGRDPSLIVGDVASGAYESVDPEPEGGSSVSHEWMVHCSAPYFATEGSLDLTPIYRSLAPTSFSPSGSGLYGRLLAEESQTPLFLVSAKEAAKVVYDYNGFYSSSIVLTLAAGAAAPPSNDFYLTLDHPYVYVTALPDVEIKGTEETVSLPMTIGKILDPAYPGR